MGAELERREGRLTSPDGTGLFWQSWEVPSPLATFAVVHGLGEHGGRYAAFASAMAARRMSTFAIDLRGMGRSDGARGRVSSWSDWVADTRLFVEMVAATSPVEVIPLGHSFGGVVVLSSVLRGALAPGRFVLSNPALRLRMGVPGWKLALGRLTSSLVPNLSLGNEVDPALLSRDPEVVAAYRRDPLVHDRISTRLFSEWLSACDEAFARASEISIPFLLLVGEEDGVIDPEGSRELDRLATGAGHQMHAFPGRLHEPFNDLGAGEVFDDLAAWTASTPAPPRR